MKYEMVVRSRPNPEEPPAAKHERLISRLLELSSGFWTLDSSKLGKLDDAPREPSADCSLTRALPGGVKGYVTYPNRVYLPDSATYDDHICFEFNALRVDYADLAARIFPALLQAFDAYTGVITDVDLSSRQWSENPDNRRERVVYLGTLNYLEARQCEGTFGLAPAEVPERLEGLTASAEVWWKGLLLTVSPVPLDGESLEAAGNAVWQRVCQGNRSAR